MDVESSPYEPVQGVWDASATSACEGFVTGGSLSLPRIIALCPLPRNNREWKVTLPGFMSFQRWVRKVETVVFSNGHYVAMVTPKVYRLSCP